MGPLRFAPIIRVSTELQERKGESLRSQETQILQAVNALGGVIPEVCWQYRGQESGTPGQERAKLDQLLADAGKGVFDAVICCDASRWSRDNARSKAGLEILKANGIKFFIGTMEYDLYNPTQNLLLGMSAEIGEFQALEQARKSITNRIHRARRGIPTVGSLPFGRTFNKHTGQWGIDPEKKKLIEDVVRRYIAGERLQDISKTVGIHPSTLWKIIKFKLGSEWTLRFVNKKVNVAETVTMTIPALIDDPEILKALEERVRINTLYVRGNRKYNHLLSGYLFCARCGSRMQAGANTHGRYVRYYFHWRMGTNGCKLRKMVRATELENSVLLQLIKTFGDYQLIEQAIQKSAPDIARRKELDQEAAKLTRDLEITVNRKNNVVEKIADGVITDAEAEKTLSKLRERESAINERLTAINFELASVPDPQKVRSLSKMVVKMISASTKQNPRLIFKRSDEWKRGLIEKAFSGVDTKGQRLGIYIDYDEGSEQFTYEIRGLLESTVQTLPMSDEELIGMFHLDSDYQDVKAELERIRSNIRSI